MGSDHCPYNSLRAFREEFFPIADSRGQLEWDTLNTALPFGPVYVPSNEEVTKF